MIVSSNAIYSPDWVSAVYYYVLYYFSSLCSQRTVRCKICEGVIEQSMNGTLVGMGSQCVTCLLLQVENLYRVAGSEIVQS